MTIQPVNLNNFIVELSSEYYLEMSAKEVEKRLNDKIKELEKQEKELEDTLKNHSEEAQKELASLYSRWEELETKAAECRS